MIGTTRKLGPWAARAHPDQARSRAACAPERGWTVAATPMGRRNSRHIRDQDDGTTAACALGRWAWRATVVFNPRVEDRRPHWFLSRNPRHHHASSEGRRPTTECVRTSRFGRRPAPSQGRSGRMKSARTATGAQRSARALDSGRPRRPVGREGDMDRSSGARGVAEGERPQGATERGKLDARPDLGPLRAGRERRCDRGHRVSGAEGSPARRRPIGRRRHGLALVAAEPCLGEDRQVVLPQARRAVAVASHDHERAANGPSRRGREQAPGQERHARPRRQRNQSPHQPVHDSEPSRVDRDADRTAPRRTAETGCTSEPSRPSRRTQVTSTKKATTGRADPRRPRQPAGSGRQQNIIL